MRHHTSQSLVIQGSLILNHRRSADWAWHREVSASLWSGIWKRTSVMNGLIDSIRLSGAQVRATKSPPQH